MRLRAIALHVGVLVLYTLLALLHTRPLWAHLRTAFLRAQHHDVLLHAWIVNWTARQLARAPQSLFDSNSFFPFPLSLAYTEHLVPEALPVVPLQALTGDPILTYNVAFLLTFVLGGWGAFLLARHLTGSVPAAVVAGAFACYFPAKRWSYGHINTIAVHWMPFAMLALHRVLARPGTWRAAQLGVAVALASLASAYFTLYFPLLLVLATPLIWWLEGHPLEGRRVVAVVLAAVIALAIALPVVWPYAVLWEEGSFHHGYESQIEGAADVARFLLIGSWVWWRTFDPPLAGDGFFPGLVACALIGAGLLGLGRDVPGKGGAALLGKDRARRWRAAACGLGLVLLALAAWRMLAELFAHFEASLPVQGPTGPIAPGPRPDVQWRWPATWGAVGSLLLALSVDGRAAVRRLRERLRRASGIAWAYLLLAAVANLIAMGARLQFFGLVGPRLPGHWLYQLPLFNALRVPGRAAFIGQVMLVVPMAFGARALLGRARRWTGRRRTGDRAGPAGGLVGRVVSGAAGASAGTAAAGLLLALMTLELLHPPIPPVPPPSPEADVDGWLAGQPDDFGAMHWPPPPRMFVTADEQWRSTYHWKRLPFGHNQDLPRETRDLFAMGRRGALGERFLTFVEERFPFRYFVVHLHVFGDEERRAWLDERLDHLGERWDLERSNAEHRIYRVRNGAAAVSFRRRFPRWMVSGRIAVDFSVPVPARLDRARVLVSMDGTGPVAARLREGDTSLSLEVVGPASADHAAADDDAFVWVRVRLSDVDELPAGADGRPFHVRHLRFLHPDGSSYP